MVFMYVDVIRGCFNKINKYRIELMEIVKVRENNKNLGWKLADKDIVDIKQCLLLDYATHLEMMKLKIKVCSSNCTIMPFILQIIYL